MSSLRTTPRSKDIPLDLVDFVSLGEPAGKKIQVDFEIREDAQEVKVYILARGSKEKSRESQELLRSKLEGYFHFDKDYWEEPEWKQMLGIQQAPHWVDRILLLCRAQAKSREDKAVVKDIIKYAPFVLLPDGAVFSTQLLWPPHDPKNLLGRVPKMVLWFAYLQFHREQYGDTSSGPESDPRKMPAEWLNQFFIAHGGSLWWLLRKKVSEETNPPQPLITDLDVANFIRRHHTLRPPWENQTPP